LFPGIGKQIVNVRQRIMQNVGNQRWQAVVFCGILHREPWVSFDVDIGVPTF
jgi:hypothetical protein